MLWCLIIQDSGSWGCPKLYFLLSKKIKTTEILFIRRRPVITTLPPFPSHISTSLNSSLSLVARTKRRRFSIKERNLLFNGVSGIVFRNSGGEFVPAEEEFRKRQLCIGFKVSLSWVHFCFHGWTQNMLGGNLREGKLPKLTLCFTVESEIYCGFLIVKFAVLVFWCETDEVKILHRKKCYWPKWRRSFAASAKQGLSRIILCMYFYFLGFLQVLLFAALVGLCVYNKCFDI